jgi:enamine deaminase RidA (YjgF/YER057c/UK114 family)
MMRYQTCNPYEQEFGYSRAVRRGPFIFISGTTSIDPNTGEILHPTSAYHQAIRIFQEIITAVEAVGGNKIDIARVRIFVTAQEDAGDVGRALKEVFGDIGPAASMIIGAKFVAPKMLVEIEADAVVLW